MYLMYVDESGDTGLPSQGSPSQYFALSGLVLHELKWREFLDRILTFRKRMRATYGLKIREEVHAAEWIRKGKPSYLDKHIRLAILRNFADELSQIDFISVTNVIVDKQGKPADYDVFENAWRTLFQRFSNTLNYRNFNGPANPQDLGIVFCDDTSGKKLNQVMRKMYTYNPIPNMGGTGYRDIPVKNIIEDPSMRNSKDSYLIQAADLCAFMLYQHHAPNSYIRKKTGHGYFKKLTPILNTNASRADPLGIVKL